MNAAVRPPPLQPQSMVTCFPAARSVAELVTVTVRWLSPGTVVLTVIGEVDMLSAPVLGDRLGEQIRTSGPDVIVDLTEVFFFGAAGLAVLAAARNAAAVAAVRLDVVASCRAVLMPMTITGLAAALHVHPDIEAALRQRRTERRHPSTGTMALPA